MTDRYRKRGDEADFVIKCPTYKYNEAQAKIDRLKEARKIVLDATTKEMERWQQAVDAEAIEKEEIEDRYEKTSNNTVVDNHTGLEWQAETVEPMTWDEAMKYAESLGNGWRMPTIKELSTLIDYDRVDPATTFPGHGIGSFWSSSVYAYYAGVAWRVDFSNGSVYNYGKNYTNHVRCVRRRTEV